MADDGAYLFLTGADMDPQLVKQAYPGAQFVARGWTEVRQGQVNPTFGHAVAASGVGDVWGILVHVPGGDGGALVAQTVTADDGRTFEAGLIGDRLVNGEAAETLKAAQYWELPPVYITRLKQAMKAAGVGGKNEE